MVNFKGIQISGFKFVSIFVPLEEESACIIVTLSWTYVYWTGKDIKKRIRTNHFSMSFRLSEAEKQTKIYDLCLILSDNTFFYYSIRKIEYLLSHTR